jgi:protease secretion system outer membrane protein
MSLIPSFHRFSVWRLAAVLLFSLTLVPASQAQTFREALTAAERVDAQFAAALAGVSGRRVQVQETGAAFYPAATVSLTPGGIGGSGTNRTVTVSQPLLSYDRYLIYQQSDLLAEQASAEERQARVDLSQRLFKSMAEIIRNREAIRATGVQIEGLETQLRRARRMHELGQGTITEVSDFEVRLAVAQANRVSQQNALQAAQRSFALITGMQARPDAVSVEDAAPGPAPSPQDAAYLDRVRDGSSTVVLARQSFKLQEIATSRIRAQYLPELVATATHGHNAGAASSFNNTRIGLTLTAPITAGQFFSDRKAATELVRAQENLRYAQENVSNEALRLLRAAQSFDVEVDIRRRAVDSARLALEGNLKSYQGGVKSNIDVVTSYQNLADTEVALANSELSRIETRLGLRLLDPAVAVAP